MGTIKDIVDLTTQLANSVKDRKIAGDLNSIQQLLLQLQSEQADLHDANMKLREERLLFTERIQKLEAKIVQLESTPVAGPDGVPTCPNCSKPSKPIYMAALPKDFVNLGMGSHECSLCKYVQR